MQTFERWVRAICRETPVTEVSINTYRRGNDVVSAYAIHLPTGKELGHWDWDDIPSESNVPKFSADEFFALPEGGGFKAEKCVIDGKNVIIPVPADDIESAWVPEDHPICYYDATGRAWKLGKFKDGSYGRMPFGW